MTRYSHLRWLAPLGGVVAVGVIAFSALPAGSTIVCPNGIKPPSPYCTNVPPTATTGTASNVTASSATLNGVAGSNVKGGDDTQYFFRYGPTASYGSQTATGTIPSCPSGITPPSPYCNGPATQAVFANIAGLAPCTDYHFQLFANNNDGSAVGGDRTFTSAFAPPLKNVKAPSKVKAGKKFKVKFTLLYNTERVHITLKNHNGVAVASSTLGPLGPGKYTVTLHAPRKRGTYTLQVIARLSCGQQSVSQRVKVH
jgi:hypothetical protein